MTPTDKQKEPRRQDKWDFSDLKALYLNCTLKKSPEMSHTKGLIGISRGFMELNGVETELHRPVDFDIAPGVYPDMTEHGWVRDDWPKLQERVMAADILVLGSPIWLGDKSSIGKLVIETAWKADGSGGRAEGQNAPL